MKFHLMFFKKRVLNHLEKNNQILSKKCNIYNFIHYLLKLRINKNGTIKEHHSFKIHPVKLIHRY
jgi:hypothetical protein